MKQYLLSTTLSFITMFSQAQSHLPYYEVPDFPGSYNAGTVSARMIDGLGFRFYWATDSVSLDDLKYKPSEEARTFLETVEHIYGMSKLVVNATKGAINTNEKENLSFDKMRNQTLENLKEASDVLKTSDDLAIMTIKYQGKERLVEYPFWLHLNGPISDCIWHTGQLVSMRRASGNPISDKPSFFTGKVKR